MSAWLRAWKKQHGVAKPGRLDREIEAAASKIAGMAAREPDRWKRRRLVRAARRFAFNWTHP
jgi:hypothetical protein